MSYLLDQALEHIFGAPARDIRVSHIDHLCSVLTPDKVRSLLRAAGGDWETLLFRTEQKQLDAKGAKDPGVDVRNTRTT